MGVGSSEVSALQLHTLTGLMGPRQFRMYRWDAGLGELMYDRESDNPSLEKLMFGCTHSLHCLGTLFILLRCPISRYFPLHPPILHLSQTLIIQSSIYLDPVSPMSFYISFPEH